MVALLAGANGDAGKGPRHDADESTTIPRHEASPDRAGSLGHRAGGPASIPPLPAIDFEGTLRVWLERPDREWIGALVPAMLAAAVTWGTVLFHRRRILARSTSPARTPSTPCACARTARVLAAHWARAHRAARLRRPATIHHRARWIWYSDAGAIPIPPEADVLEWTMAVGPSVACRHRPCTAARGSPGASGRRASPSLSMTIAAGQGVLRGIMASPWWRRWGCPSHGELPSSGC